MFTYIFLLIHILLCLEAAILCTNEQQTLTVRYKHAKTMNLLKLFLDEITVKSILILVMPVADICPTC